MKLPRFRWKDIKTGQEFEIIIDRFVDARTTYYRQFVVLNAYFDVGVGDTDLRKCELSLPLKPFIHAMLEYPRTWRINLKDKKMKVRILKLRESRMRILEMVEA